MTVVGGLVWQANFVRQRQSLLARARAQNVMIEFRGEPTFFRKLMGDRIVWALSIPPESEFYDHIDELRRAFPEAYINHMGPVMEAVPPGSPAPTTLMLDTPATSPPVRSAWWGF